MEDAVVRERGRTHLRFRPHLRAIVLCDIRLCPMRCAVLLWAMCNATAGDELGYMLCDVRFSARPCRRIAYARWLGC
eukprot:941870-Rhodomonas_salina.1